MFNEITLEFAINCAKADDLYESALATYNINKQKIISQYKSGYFAEAEDARDAVGEAKKNFIEKTKEFFKKIKDAIAEAISKIVNKFKMMVAEKQLLKKLEKLEAAAAGTTAIAKLKVDGEIIDVNECFKLFKDFNKDAIRFAKGVYGKRYETIEEAQRVASELDEKLTKAVEKFDIDMRSMNWIGCKICDLVKMTKYDAANFKNIMDDIQHEMDEGIAFLMMIAIEEENPVIANIAKKIATQLSQAGMKSANKILSEVTGRFSKISTAMKSVMSTD